MGRVDGTGGAHVTSLATSAMVALVIFTPAKGATGALSEEPSGLLSFDALFSFKLSLLRGDCAREWDEGRRSGSRGGW